MHRAIVPVATMLAIQVMISFSVLALSVMMPVVAADLAIDPKLVGIFTAIIYEALPFIVLGVVFQFGYAITVAPRDSIYPQRDVIRKAIQQKDYHVFGERRAGSLY